MYEVKNKTKLTDNVFMFDLLIENILDALRIKSYQLLHFVISHLYYIQTIILVPRMFCMNM